jgi:biotin transport system substrate-specific component
MRNNTRALMITGLFAALTAISAYVAIPIGPAPITMQLLLTLLSGVLLGHRLGPISQLVYMIMGLVGLPVFAGGMGGPSYIFSPTFGYVIGFIAASFVVGKFLQFKHPPRVFDLWLACLAGVFVVYLIGYPYLFVVMKVVLGVEVTFLALLKPAVLVFLPGDLLKLMLAVYIGKKVRPLILSLMV